MAWTLLESNAPMMRWQARLTADAPTPGPLPLALIRHITAQAEGTFSGATVLLSGSNSGGASVPLTSMRHAEIVALLPVYTLYAELVDPADADVLVTVAGRR